MLHYILQTIAFQLFFLVVYDIFLKKETFFNWNRAYLLITAIASLTFPFLKFESIRTVVPQQFVIRLPEVIIGNVSQESVNSSGILPLEPSMTSSFAWSWEHLLYAGMVLATLILIYKIIKISILINNNPKRWKGNLLIVNLLKSTSAFSFFHYVFLGELIKEDDKEAILKHESVHVAQKHTMDLLLFEILRILFWFNPLIYMYQNRMTTLHEYIADSKAVKQGNKSQYYQNLLSQVFDTQHISFTNTFYKQSLIKKRIVMLSKSKSNRIHLLKYALLIPLIAGMLMYTSSYAQKVPMQSQDITLDELVELYYLELAENDRVGNDMSKLDKEFFAGDTKYIWTKDELARSKAFFKYISKLYMEERSANNTLDDETLNSYQKMLDLHKTYDEYLDYKKTDKAKKTWESISRDGVLRLFVEDMKNFTEIEKTKREDKIALIEKDDYYHSLLVTDGMSSTTMQIHSIDGKDIPGPKLSQKENEMEKNYTDVPFSVIEQVPTFETCLNLATQEEIRMCTSNTIADFVNKNFNTNLGKELGLKGRQRINVMFKIGTDGKIDDIKARAPHPALEAEAKRVIAALPQMIPGTQRGEPVVVPYSLPIIFQVGE